LNRGFCGKTEEIYDEGYEYVYTINPRENGKPPICQLQVNGKSVEMMINSGASVNLLDESLLQDSKVTATKV